ncbi:MAG: hypothetical protein R2729_23190 [Bryobacteraceae bacterium]
MADRDEAAALERNEDGVDLTLIRWMLSLTPAERLALLDANLDFVLRTRELNGIG